MGSGEDTYLGPWMMSARSLVILPLSTHSMHAASSFWQKSASAGFSSSFARCARPRVHAKMDAMLLVLVSPPFWCTRKCRVTVPCAASASMVFPSGHTSTLVMRPRLPKPAARNPVRISKALSEEESRRLEAGEETYREQFELPWAQFVMSQREF